MDYSNIIETYTHEYEINENLNKECIELLNKQKAMLDNEIDLINEASISDYVSKFINFLKKIFNKAISFIISIWKKLINMISKVLKFILDKFKKLFSKKTSNDNISYSASFCMEASYMNFKQYPSIEKMYNAYKSSIINLNGLIREYSLKNIDHLKQIRDFNIKAASINTVSESYECMMEKVIFYDNKIFTFKHHDPKERNANYQGSSFIDEALLENIESLSINDLEDVLEAQNNEIEVFYNITMENLVNYINNHASNKLTDIGIVKNRFLWELNDMMKDMSNDFIKRNLVMKFIDNDFITDFPNTKEGISNFRAYIRLIINKNKTIIERLENMMRLNSCSFYINYNQYLKSENLKDLSKISSKELIDDIEQQKFNNFNRIFKDNADSFIYYNGELLDFSELNLGKIIVAPEVLKQSNNPFSKLLNTEYSTMIYNYISRYDITVISHGVSGDYLLIEYYKQLSAYERSIFKKLYYNEIHYIEKETQKSIDNLSSDDLVKMGIRFNLYGNIFINDSKKYFPKINGLRSSKNISVLIKDFYIKRLVCNPIQTPYRNNEYTDIECLLYRLITEGYKRINVLSCNLGGMKITNKEFTRNGILIAISTRNLEM